MSAAITLLAGCAIGGGYKDDVPAALTRIEGVTSVKVAGGYDGLSRRTLITVGLDPSSVDADQLREIFIALADEADFAGAGEVSLMFTDAGSGGQIDLREAVDGLVARHGEPAEEVARAMDTVKELAGVSATGNDTFDDIADYVRN